MDVTKVSGLFDQIRAAYSRANEVGRSCEFKVSGRKE